MQYSIQFKFYSVFIYFELLYFGPWLGCPTALDRNPASDTSESSLDAVGSMLIAINSSLAVRTSCSIVDKSPSYSWSGALLFIAAEEGDGGGRRILGALAAQSHIITH